jgi:hypothetical protein
VGEGNFGNDYVKLTFRNGSLLDVMTPLNSTRGNRATAGILDEFRDHDAGDINEIILPRDRGLLMVTLIEKDGELKTKRCA